MTTPRPASINAANPAASSGAAGCEILIVDDNAPLRRVMAAALRSGGYSVCEAGDGRDALERLRQHRFRLLVTDIFMPDVDGFELIMHLRGVQPPPAILAMSGDGFADTEVFLQAARHFGVKQTLLKPFSLDELAGAVRQLIGDPAIAPPQGT